MRHNERDLEKQCCKYARELGLAAVKLENNGNTGISDVAIIEKGGRTLYVEFKTETGVLSDEQKFWKEYLGYSCHTIRCYDEFCTIIDNFQKCVIIKNNSLKQP